MAEPYVSVTVDLPESQAEALEDLFHESGALGLEIRDSEAPPMPGVRGPAKGEAIVVAWFDTAAAAAEVESSLHERFPEARVKTEGVVQQDWSNAWKSLIRSVEVGPLWVGPPWLLETAPKDRERIVIEPKMAFGTGDHPTTQLCLEALAAFVPTHQGCAVLDVGTGTGVLAIAARKLGAGRVVGVDNDPMSVELANENAAVNRTPELELSGKRLEQIDGVFELVVANILANTLVELAPQIVRHVGTQLHLAGVLAHQRDEVAAAYLAQGLIDRGGARNGDWVRIDLQRPR